jgi:hypothetical protein
MFNKLFLKEDGSFSTTKVGAMATALSGLIAAICGMHLQVLHIPAVVADIGTLAGTIGAFLGGAVTVSGARDAIGKK